MTSGPVHSRVKDRVLALVDRWAAVWPYGTVILVILAAQIRVLTHVTGEDSLTYTRLGIELLESGFRLHAWRSVAGFIAPGYPFLLAVVMALFGPGAVPWVNGILLAGAFCLVLSLFRRWGMTRAEASLAVLTALWLLFAGYPINAHFLLYAFRGAPQFFFTAWAVHLVAGQASDGGFGRAAAATLVLMLGATMRETTLFAWPGLVLYVAWHPQWRGSRWRGWIGLLLPGVIVVAVYLLLVFGGVIPHNTQIEAWGYFVARGFGPFLDRMAGYGRITLRDAGWIGGGLFVLGCWRNRPERWAIWTVPAILLMLFYSGFMVHQRYFLESLMLLAVVSGMGAVALLSIGVRRAPARLRRPAPAMAVLVLLGLNGWAIARLPEWGPRVDMKNIREFVAAIETHGGGHPEVLADPQCRYVTDALIVHARRRPIYQLSSLDQLNRASPLLFVRSASRDHWRQHPGIDLAEALRRHADLIPVRDESGRRVKVRLGDLRYALYHATPWSETVVEEPLERAHESGGLLWLDFRQSDREAQRTIERLDAQGRVRQRWELKNGFGLVPLRTTYRARRRDGDRLRVTSSSPLPRRLLAQPVEIAGGGYFPIVGERRAAVMSWLAPPTVLGADQDVWGGVITDRAAFRIPLPLGTDGETYMVSFVTEPRWITDQTVVLRYAANDRMLGVFTNTLNRARMYHDLLLNPAEYDSPVHIQAEFADGALNGNHLRLVYIGFRMVENADLSAPPPP